MDVLRQELLNCSHPSSNISVHQAHLSGIDGIELLFANIRREHLRIDFVVKQDGTMAGRCAGDISERDGYKMFAYVVFVDSQRRICTDRYNQAMEARQK